MKRITILLFLAVLAAGCEKQVISRRDTLSDQFNQMNKQGWAVDDPSRPRPVAGTPDPNVRIIREANFSAYQFNTNFQVDDPRFRPPSTTQPAASQPATAPPGAHPFGIP